MKELKCHYTTLAMFFFKENTICEENNDQISQRFLNRDDSTGKPDYFRDINSMQQDKNMKEKASTSKAVVIDRRSGLFLRSTEARQNAFKFRNSVLREITDVHYKMRPI